MLLGQVALYALIQRSLPFRRPTGHFVPRTNEQEQSLHCVLPWSQRFCLLLSSRCLLFLCKVDRWGGGAFSILLTSFTAGSIVSVGLWSLRSSGYQLQYYARRSLVASRTCASQNQLESIPPAFSNDESGLRGNENQVDSTMLDIEEKRDDSSVLDYPHFRWTILFVVAAILSSLVSAGLNSYRNNRDSSIANLKRCRPAIVVMVFASLGRTLPYKSFTWASTVKSIRGTRVSLVAKLTFFSIFSRSALISSKTGTISDFPGRITIAGRIGEPQPQPISLRINRRKPLFSTENATSRVSKG